MKEECYQQTLDPQDHLVFAHSPASSISSPGIVCQLSLNFIRFGCTAPGLSLLDFDDVDDDKEGGAYVCCWCLGKIQCPKAEAVGGGGSDG